MTGVLIYRFVAAPVEEKGLDPALAAPTGATVELGVAVEETVKLDRTSG
jgi:hypothetical protein